MATQDDRRLASSDAAAAVALIAGANVVLYAFSIGAARLLSVDDFGRFAGYYALIALINVVIAAVQLSTASTVASSTEGRDARPDARNTLAVAAVAFAITFAAMVLLSNDVSLLLVASAALVAAAYVPWNLVTGIYQGQGRMVAYGALMLSQSVVRLTALFALAVRAEPGVLMAGVAVAMFVPLWLASGALRGRVNGPRIRVRWQGLGRTTIVAGTVGFVTLGDVAMVNVVSDHGDGGAYAAVALLGRVVVFIPTALGPIYFPTFVRLADADRERRRVLFGVSAVAGFVSATVAAAIIVAPGLALDVTVGDAYESGRLFVTPYMIAGWTIGVAALIAHERLAVGDAVFVWAVAAPSLGVMIIASAFATTPLAVAWWMAGGASVVLAGGLVRAATAPTTIDLRDPVSTEERAR